MKNPVLKDYPHILLGADYNPEQWLHMPEVLEKDIQFWQEANMNSFSVGIFSWSVIEPEEGVYNFSHLDDVMDRAAEAGGKIVLATPSGARPHWLAQKYPEVLRVNERREKLLFGERHNHCFTSPVYREKVQNINRRLAERYKDHPALGIWHISNEYNGNCHCPLCQAAFREWLKKKYHNNLDELNRAWWSTFWSHTITDWEQIESPSSLGEYRVHGLNLDWMRFVSDQTIDFLKSELVPIREVTPDVPVTTNFTGFNHDINYWRAKEVLDVTSWDNYPSWHNDEEPACYVAAKTAMVHDMYRCFKNKPFFMMESTPSCVNWKPVNKLMRPGMNTLQAFQAISHGADGVMYFQFRKSRGGMEKFHGAVIDHVGHQDTRVYREVQSLGARLKGLDELVGVGTKSEVALVFDWENIWLFDDIAGYHNNERKYIPTCEKHYYPFWKNGISVDVLDMDGDFAPYKLVVMPMAYMLRPGVEEKIEAYVRGGGTIVFTYISGIVDENDLCYLGGWPGGRLKEVFGIWAEETDTLYPSDRNHVEVDGKIYTAVDYCDLIHLRGAKALGAYQEDFYAGRPALTVNGYGAGRAYYIAFRDTGDFLVDFYEKLMTELALVRNLQGELPENVTAQRRGDFIFLENFGENETVVPLHRTYKNYETNKVYPYECVLAPREVKILVEI